MKILHLNLKKKWFDMILSGEKKEEYREIKPYWTKRLRYKDYAAISFRNGYAKDAPQMLVEYTMVLTGIGHPSWGAPKDKPVFILHLGKIISTENA